MGPTEASRVVVGYALCDQHICCEIRSSCDRSLTACLSVRVCRILAAKSCGCGVRCCRNCLRGRFGCFCCRPSPVLKVTAILLCVKLLVECKCFLCRSLAVCRCCLQCNVSVRDLSGSDCHCSFPGKFLLRPAVQTVCA